MNAPQPERHGHTVADWKTWEGRWELINGVAYDMTSAPSVAHQRVVFRLGRILADALDEERRKAGRGDCEVFIAPIDLYLPGQESVLQPDLLVVCDPSKIADHGIVGAPDLVAEILSPSNATKDTVVKRWAYAAAGIPEYLIVDPVERFGTLLRLEGGYYVDGPPIGWDSVVSLLGGHLSLRLGSPLQGPPAFG